MSILIVEYLNFVFALTFYYIIKFYLAQKISVRDFILFSAVILFFGLNNFYIGMINLTFVLLFSIYMAIERTEGTYECYCPTCFVKLKRESSNNNTEFKGFILCKHTQARVMRVVEAIQTELDNRSTSNTIAVE